MQTAYCNKRTRRINDRSQTIVNYRDFDQVELDRQYSPSSCIADIGVFLARYAESSRQARDAAAANGTLAGDLQYGLSTDEGLDLFMPPGDRGGPLHIYIHGGYWQLLSKDDSSFAAPVLQRYGSYFAALNYSLAPSVRLTQIVQQNRDAICWLYHHADNWGFDRTRIYLSGSSAGAHLVAMMMLTDWEVYGLPADTIKGVCAVSGIYDLVPISKSYVNDVLQLGQEETADCSPIGKPLPSQCPVILAYGDNETTEFKRQTDEYAEFLSGEGVSVDFREVAARNHFDVIMDLADEGSWLSQQVLLQMGLGGR
jgi:arylformamidase